MNFKSHIKVITRSLEECLATGEKSAIVGGLSECLQYAKSLLKIDAFDFWLAQINEIEISEIAMTKFGVNEALMTMRYSKTSDSNSLRSELESVCEYVLAYSKDGDDCPLQSQYHHYFDLRRQAVFKESELGLNDNSSDLIPPEKGEFRVAKLSELNVSPSELV